MLTTSIDKPKKIIISGYFGFDNFGDELILHILVRELKQLLELPEILVLSKKPEQTANDLEVRSINRMNFLEYAKELKNADLLISGGGSLLQDVTSRLTIFYYLLIILVAQLFKVKTFIYSQGIGPINRKISLWFTKYILSKVNYITVRDMNSYNMLKSLSLEPQLTSDPAWLPLNSSIVDVSKIKSINMVNADNILGVNIRPWKDIGETELKTLAESVQKVALDDSSQIVIMPLQFNQDIEICRKFYKILTSINKDLNVLLIDKNLNVSQWNLIINNCHKLIAMRFHALVIGMVHKKELFGLSYDPKVETLLSSVQAKFATITEWKDNKLNEKFCEWMDLSKKGLTYKEEILTNNYELARQNLSSIVRILE